MVDRQKTLVVDGGAARIAELEAENERLRDEQVQHIEQMEDVVKRTLAERAGVKVSDILSIIALWSDDEGLDLSFGQGDDLARRILSALTTEPAAPEGQQDDEPRAYIVHAPEDGYYGTGPDRLQFHPLAQHDMDNGYRQTPLYGRPSDQAVTEAMHLREAASLIVPYLRWTIGDESPGCHPTMPSAVGAFMAAFGWATEEEWHAYRLASLTAAMEAKR